MKKYRWTWLFAALYFIMQSPAWAWGPIGHRAVAIIAQERLSPAAQAALGRILGKGVALADIATCADEIKFGDYNCGGVLTLKQNKQSALWHFIDIPISTTPKAENDLRPYCHAQSQNAAGACAEEQLQYELQVLQNPATAQDDKKIALMFFVHFMGDEHQPLHCADDHDRGGNSKKIKFKGISGNLHALWDSAISPDLLKDDTTRWQPGVESHSKYWTTKEAKDAADLARALKSDMAKKDISSWTQAGPKDMLVEAALESFKIAKEDIYPAYAKADNQNLGEKYQAAMQPIAYDRLERAGVRLAYLLNLAFK